MEFLSICFTTTVNQIAESSNNNDNNYNSNSNDNRDNIKSKDDTTTTNNNNSSNDNDNPRTSKQRKGNTIWFNPPFGKNVATKFGRYFLYLIGKYFPRDHKLRKFENIRNNILKQWLDISIQKLCFEFE